MEKTKELLLSRAEFKLLFAKAKVNEKIKENPTFRYLKLCQDYIVAFERIYGNMLESDNFTLLIINFENFTQLYEGFNELIYARDDV